MSIFEKKKKKFKNEFPLNSQHVNLSIKYNILNLNKKFNI